MGLIPSLQNTNIFSFFMKNIENNDKKNQELIPILLQLDTFYLDHPSLSPDYELPLSLENKNLLFDWILLELEEIQSTKQTEINVEHSCYEYFLLLRVLFLAKNNNTMYMEKFTNIISKFLMFFLNQDASNASLETLIMLFMTVLLNFCFFIKNNTSNNNTDNKYFTSIVKDIFIPNLQSLPKSSTSQAKEVKLKLWCNLLLILEKETIVLKDNLYEACLAGCWNISNFMLLLKCCYFSTSIYHMINVRNKPKFIQY